jgi:ribosomal protein S18 acetylase RimI-like enzyme
MYSQDNIEIRLISADDTLSLRQAVLWPNKVLSELILDEDKLNGSLPFGSFLKQITNTNTIQTNSNDQQMFDQVLVAVISVFQEPLPIPISSQFIETSLEIHEPKALHNSTMRFRKFACHKDYQGMGIGTQLLQHLFETVKTKYGCNLIWCDARESAKSFYTSRGMIEFGETFHKENVPYIRMMKVLQ